LFNILSIFLRNFTKQTIINYAKGQTCVLTTKKTLKKTRIKLHNTLALPVLLYGGETWTIKASDARRITAAEMKYMRRTAGYTWDRLQNKCTNCKGCKASDDGRITAAEMKYMRRTAGYTWDRLQNKCTNCKGFKASDARRITAAEMKYMRRTAGYTWDRLQNKWTNGQHRSLSSFANGRLGYFYSASYKMKGFLSFLSLHNPNNCSENIPSFLFSSPTNAHT